MKDVVIVDSGSANLYSIFKACEMVSLKPFISDQPEIIADAKAVIFPGVGFFDHAAKTIRKKKITDAATALKLAMRLYIVKDDNKEKIEE